MKSFDLDNRLLDFSVLIIDIVRSVPSSKEGNYLSNQMVRSGLSPFLNYGEAISGESRKDFIHKIKIVLKELRETYNCLRLIKRTGLLNSNTALDKALTENNELISIFVQSVKTARKNMNENI